MKKTAAILSALITAALFSVNAAADAAVPPSESPGIGGSEAVLFLITAAVAAVLIAVAVCVIRKRKARKSAGEAEKTGEDGKDPS